MKKKKYVEIWGEHIELKRFLLGLFISIALLVGVLIVLEVSNASNTSKLVYGLITIILGFMFNIKFIRPKRNVVMKEAEDNDN